MSPAANILYVGASSCQNADLVAAVNSVLDNDLAQVITNSYGSVGEPSTTGEVQAAHQSALQAAAQGVSLLFSSGDSGDETVSSGSRQVDFTTSEPFVHGQVDPDQRAVGPGAPGIPLWRWRWHEQALPAAGLPEGRRARGDRQLLRHGRPPGRPGRGDGR